MYLVPLFFFFFIGLYPPPLPCQTVYLYYLQFFRLLLRPSLSLIVLSRPLLSWYSSYVTFPSNGTGNVMVFPMIFLLMSGIGKKFCNRARNSKSKNRRDGNGSNCCCCCCCCCVGGGSGVGVCSNRVIASAVVLKLHLLQSLLKGKPAETLTLFIPPW